MLKREYFNRWYRLHPFFFAMHIAKLPIQLMLAFLYLNMVYLITDQPLEIKRIALFYSISLLVFLTSESLGLLVASRLSVVVSNMRNLLMLDNNFAFYIRMECLSALSVQCH